MQVMRVHPKVKLGQIGDGKGSLDLHGAVLPFSMVARAKWRFDRDLEARVGEVVENTSSPRVGKDLPSSPQGGYPPCMVKDLQC